MAITRRLLLRTGAVGAVIGGAAVAAPGLAAADVSHSSEQIGKIYELQATFHRAKTTQDLDLMMSLWAKDARFFFTINGQTYIGADEIRSFFQGSGSFIHHRFSLVPSYKIVIQVHGHTAFHYFECHDVGEFATGNFDDPTVTTIASSTYLAGTLRKVGGRWFFWRMTGGSSSPLSNDTYYFPIP